MNVYKVSEHTSRLGRQPKPCCRHPLRYVCVCFTANDPLCVYTTIYTGQTLVTLSEKQHLIWHGHQFKQDQYAPTVSHDDVSLRASTTVNRSRSLPSFQFHAQRIGSSMCKVSSSFTTASNARIKLLTNSPIMIFKFGFMLKHSRQFLGDSA